MQKRNTQILTTQLELSQCEYTTFQTEREDVSTLEKCLLLVIRSSLLPEVTSLTDLHNTLIRFIILNFVQTEPRGRHTFCLLALNMMLVSYVFISLLCSSTHLLLMDI